MAQQEEVKLPTYETLLAEAIRSLTVDSGLVSFSVAPGANLFQDNTKDWQSNVHVNRLVKIIKGQGAGQLAVITGNTPTGLTISGTWAKGLNTTSFYVILEKDLAQILRDVFGGGSDISAANPLETHDPTIEDVEDKLDHPDYGLAALKALIDSLAGGAFYGSYGPKNVEVDNDVDFGTILYDPAGNIITVGEITPGTYTVNRVRVAVDTEIVGSPPLASSEAAGRVYMTYAFPAVSWNVGDIFYITFSGIQVTLDGVTTEYPNLFIWGRVVREADISAKVDAVEAKLDLSASEATFTYLDAGGERTVFTFTPTVNTIIQTIWLDLANLTQNNDIRIKIGGVITETFNWTTGMDDGVYFRNIALPAGKALLVSVQETADEGADRDIPYYYVYEERG